jgi:hypothetical protein
MIQITTITDDADQLFYTTLDDGSVLTIELVYRPGIQRWSMNISHPLLTLNGYNLCTHENILRPYRNNIPFGIMIASTDGYDPVSIEDFVNGRILFYILNASDVAYLEENVFIPTPLVNA